DIMDVEMATGEPVVYDLDAKLNVVSKKKLN
ncbi:phosphoglyceromutase, partial [Loigolactobacillus coryniformis]|nr:phosphoglyceromutase [Loigolactobacillus coryniformis]